MHARQHPRAAAAVCLGLPCVCQQGDWMTGAKHPAGITVQQGRLFSSALSKTILMLAKGSFSLSGGKNAGRHSRVSVRAWQGASSGAEQSGMPSSSCSVTVCWSWMRALFTPADACHACALRYHLLNSLLNHCLAGAVYPTQANAGCISQEGICRSSRHLWLFSRRQGCPGAFCSTGSASILACRCHASRPNPLWRSRPQRRSDGGTLQTAPYPSRSCIHPAYSLELSGIVPYGTTTSRIIISGLFALYSHTFTDAPSIKSEMWRSFIG